MATRAVPLIKGPVASRLDDMARGGVDRREVPLRSADSCAPAGLTQNCTESGGVMFSPSAVSMNNGSPESDASDNCEEVELESSDKTASQPGDFTSLPSEGSAVSPLPAGARRRDGDAAPAGKLSEDSAELGAERRKKLSSARSPRTAGAGLLSEAVVASPRGAAELGEDASFRRSLAAFHGLAQAPGSAAEVESGAALGPLGEEAVVARTMAENEALNQLSAEMQGVIRNLENDRNELSRHSAELNVKLSVALDNHRRQSRRIDEFKATEADSVRQLESLRRQLAAARELETRLRSTRSLMNIAILSGLLGCVSLGPAVLWLKMRRSG